MWTPFRPALGGEEATPTLCLSEEFPGDERLPSAAWNILCPAVSPQTKASPDLDLDLCGGFISVAGLAGCGHVFSFQAHFQMNILFPLTPAEFKYPSQISFLNRETEVAVGEDSPRPPGRGPAPFPGLAPQPRDRLLGPPSRKV